MRMSPRALAWAAEVPPGEPMSLLDLFSKRVRRRRGDVPDVYVYDQLPDALRVQVVHVWREALGPTPYPSESSSAKVSTCRNC
jgi:hypothetical protein